MRSALASFVSGLSLACLMTLAACDPVAPHQASDGGSLPALPVGSGFDHYVLSLSWSPGYCRSLGDRANRDQCAADEPFGFVVHGLWPQFTRGYPEFCDAAEGGSVSRDIARSMLDIMPSRGLIDHQWKKHGSCSGLSQADYFATTRAALAKITIPESYEDRGDTSSVIPDSVEDAFRRANPAIPADAIAVTCDRRFLRDVRICMTKTLDGFVSCPEVDRRSCPLSTVVVPPN